MKTYNDFVYFYPIKYICKVRHVSFFCKLLKDHFKSKTFKIVHDSEADSFNRI